MILSGNGPAEPPSASNANAARLCLLGHVGLPRFHDHPHRLHGNSADRASRTCRLRPRCGLMILRVGLAYANLVDLTRPCRPARWSWTNPSRSTWRCPPSRHELSPGPTPHPERWTPPGCQDQSATRQADQPGTRARPARAARSNRRCAADRRATTSGVRAG
jgi:hypothetical protein